ncbi:iron uptake protein [Methylibium sp. Pch-M]|uniref:iron uptake protein n=1 Tax=Methylibium sp. Pch-M TaxID=2082386 RepID=UPI001011B42D|nr:iron uptake protein [Methylibium sp. Pch-M]QAZ40564.1 iron uptake protein [Methylibium sp. Pch-M]
MSTTALSFPHVASRILAGLLGGWWFVWGFVSLGITGLVSLGMPYDEAYKLAMLLAFIVFLVAFCWAFAAASLVRVWTVLAGGGAVMTAAAWWLSKALL